MGRSRLVSMLVMLGSSTLLAVAHAQTIRPVVSTELSPIRDLHVTARDGYEVFGALRVPPGEGPFPAVILLHPGISPQPWELPRRGALNATSERLLAAGYVTIWTTFRDRLEDPHALWDMLALVDFVKQMDEVDRDSVALYGCSGGGDLALDIASEISVAAAVVEEAPLILFMGIFGANKESIVAGDLATYIFSLLSDPQRFLTDELRESTREKIRRIDSPIFFAAGAAGEVDVSGDSEPEDRFSITEELQAAGLQVEQAVYPGEPHCFGMDGNTEGGQAFFNDMDAFFQRHVATQPKPIEDSLVDDLSDYGWRPSSRN